jgi:tetratricopeptide (TPR) repeat protein
MRKKRKPHPARQSIDTLAVQAKSQLQAGRFREAMDQYKQLLKKEQRREWREALADAYLGRAEQLAAKGLHKEAAALWENMANLCGKRHVGRYIEWLLQAGRVGEGVRQFAEADAAFRESPAGQELASRLAGLLVCGQVEDIDSLAGEVPLLQQRDSMLAAMRAYCRGDDAAMKDSLKAIAFRSPYRDLRSILQAMGSLGTEPQAALAQLDRVPADSPFASFVTVVRVAALEDGMLLDALSQRSEAARELVLTLKGWGKEQIDLLRRLPNARQSNAQVLLRFAMGMSTQIEISRLRRFCLELLPHVPESLPAFEKRFGSLSAFERQRIQALAAERGPQPSSANRYWRGCVEQLASNNVGEDDPLKAALILRHMAELAAESPDDDFWDEAEQEVEELLEASLKFDPQDKPTYLKLMAIARKDEDRQAQDRWAELAVRQFPEDAEVLMVAGMAAYRRGAFKKAAAFARTLLERDPINPHARNLLISCHLAHARKQLKAGKYAPAERELALAEQQARDADHLGIVRLNQGFLALVQGAEQAAEALLQQGLQALGGGLLAQFRLLVDGRRLGLAQRLLSTLYDRMKGQRVPTTTKDIVTLAELLHRYVDDGVKEIPQILEGLRAPLKAAAGQAFSEQEFRAILAALKKAGHYRLVVDYAEAGLRRFGQRPNFLFYRVFGRAQGREARLPMTEGLQLQSALQAAVKAEDQETAALIQEFLGLSGFFPGGMPPMPTDVKRAFGELMDLLETDDPRDVLDLIAEQLQGEEKLPSLPLPKKRSK